MSKDLKKTIIYSVVPMIVLMIISSFVPYLRGCCEGWMCASRTYYGFPFPYLSHFFYIKDYRFFVFDLLIYYILSFITILIIFLIKDKIKNKKVNN